MLGLSVYLGSFIRLFRSYLTVVGRVVALASTCTGRGLRSAKNGMENAWKMGGSGVVGVEMGNRKMGNKAAPRGSNSWLYTSSVFEVRGFCTPNRTAAIFPLFYFSLTAAAMHSGSARHCIRGMRGIMRDFAAMSEHRMLHPVIQLSTP